MAYKFIDNSDDYKTKMRKAAMQGLEACGQQAVSYAKQEITEQVPRNSGSWSTPTGALKNSMSHKRDDDNLVVYVGTNLSYAKYNEYGTGIYADNGAGRQGFWVFVPGSSDSSPTGGVGNAKVYTEEQARRIVAYLKSQGLDAHMTNGMKPLHFLRNAIEKHKEEYKEIQFEYMKKMF